MASIVTPPLRKMIKGVLVVKYIDDCGVKLPKMPTIPNFTPPPMPDLSFIENELAKIKSSANSNENNSIYTDEYLEASKMYDQLVEEASTKWHNEVQRIVDELDALVKEEPSLENIHKEMQLEIDKNKAKDTYMDDKKKARETSNIDNVTKFNRITQKDKKKANEAANKETQKKKNKEAEEALLLLKEILLKQYEEWVRKESEKVIRFKDEIVAAYNDTVALFKQVKAEAKHYFEEGGPGEKYVEDECDKIDRIFDNFTEAFKELSTDIVSMVAKISNPDVIVAGAATGIPNPAQKVMVFMEDMKKVMTDIKKIINYIKEILAIATMLGFAISELIPAFKKLCGDFEEKQKDTEKAFRQAVKNIRKRSKWYLEHENPKNENETKLAGYMYADAEVDWVNHEINVKGYKCYCRKEYGRTYIEDGEIKKSMWLGGYVKNGGPYTDSSGKHYYYIPAEQITGPSEYDENEILEELLRDGEDISDYDVDLGTYYDDASNTTKLNLSDGRTITIDYLAASGDIIRLDDETIIRVQ